MIIGVSAGDILLGINLLRDSLQALSNTTGSQQQYLDAVYQLETLEICLKVAQCKLSDLESTDSRSILARAISECAKCIDGYQNEIRKYETYFRSEGNSRFRHKCVKEFRKIQWLHDKDKTQALSKTIASHVQIITLACSIGSLPQNGHSSRSQTKLSDELAKVLQPSHHVPVAASRNPRWSLEAKLDAATIESGPLCRSKRRKSADERQRFYTPKTLSSSRTTSCESLRSTHTLKQVPKREFNNHFSEDYVVLSEDERSSAGSMQSFASSATKDHTHEGDSSQSIPSKPQSSRTPTTVTSIFSASSSLATPAPSLFSRRGSDATSVTIPSIAPSTTSSIPWVDGDGVCQNPSCQQRTYLQRKAFSLYTRLTHNTGSRESLHGQQKVRPTCEHVLLYLQTMQTGCLGGSEV